MPEIQDNLPQNTDGKPSCFGRYEKIRTIGKGAMGTVYEVYDPILQRSVALKMLSSKETSAENRARFLQEIQLLGKLDHPNIVQIFDSGSIDENLFFTMEYIEGKTLNAYLANLKKEQRRLTPRQALSMVMSIGEGIQYLHQKSIIHRDLKPQNILIDKKQNLKLVDFGIAKNLLSRREITTHGAILGTLGYIGPDQLNNSAQADGQSDLYSLGVILYEMLTGTLPFQAKEPYNLLWQQEHLLPPAPSSHNPKISRALDAICLKSIQYDKKKRYATIGEFLEDIQRFLKGAPVHAKAPGFLEKLWYQMKTHSTLCLGGILLLGLAILLWPSQEELEKTPQDPRMLRLLELEVASQGLSIASLTHDSPLLFLITDLEDLVQKSQNNPAVLPKAQFLLKQTYLQLRQWQLVQLRLVLSQMTALLRKNSIGDSLFAEMRDGISRLDDLLSQSFWSPSERYEALLLKAQLYERLQEYKKAKASYDLCNKIQPNPNLQSRIALCEYHLGNLIVAQPLLEQFYRAEEKLSPEALLEITQVLMNIAFQKQDWNAVQGYFSQACQQSKGAIQNLLALEEHFMSLARELVLLENYALAQKWFAEKSLQQNFSAECFYWTTVCTFYVQCFHSGIGADSENIRRSLISLRQHGAHVSAKKAAVFLSYFYWKNGNTKEAQKWIEKALQEGKEETKNDPPSTYHDLGKLYPECARLFRQNDFANFVEK